MDIAAAQLKGVTVVPVVVALCVCFLDGTSRIHKRSKGDALEKVLEFIIGNRLGHIDPVNTSALNSQAFCSSFRKSNMIVGLFSKASD
jgi:hypothetical protein